MLSEQELRTALFVLRGGTVLKPGPVHKALLWAGVLGPGRLHEFDVTTKGKEILREMGHGDDVVRAETKEADRFTRRRRETKPVRLFARVPR